MAFINQNVGTAIYELNKFLGLRCDGVGELTIEKGQSPDMCNFRITDNFKLTKRDGFEVISESVGQSKLIRGMWYGKIASNDNMLYFVANGNLYSLEDEETTQTTIGSVSGDSDNAYLFYWENCLYIINSKEFYKYNGTTLATVPGYLPKVKIGVSPDGSGGELYEEVNLLTGKKCMEFTADGTATIYYLTETSIESVDSVLVNGSVVSNYTTNTTNGTITFTVAPSNLDVVTVYWTKTISGNRAIITNNLFGVFYGGSNDVALFLWGNLDNKCRRFWSCISNPEYFPVTNYSDIGTRAYAITDIVRQYDRQIIFTEKDIYYSYIDYKDADNIRFPVYALNSDIGNIAYGMVRIINNNPVFLSKGIFELTSSNVRDERNVKNIGLRISEALSGLDLSQAITYDFAENGEYIVHCEGITYIFNYRNDTFYKYSGFNASRFLSINGMLYFGNKNGEISRFQNQLINDYVNLDLDKMAINAYWEMPYFDFGKEYLYKYLNKIYISLKPQDKTYISLSYKTETGDIEQGAELVFNLSTFVHLNFESFTFNTQYNPKPFLERLDAKRFCYIKVILSSNEVDFTATVLCVILPTVFGGKIN